MGPWLVLESEHGQMPFAEEMLWATTRSSPQPAGRCCVPGRADAQGFLRSPLDAGLALSSRCAERRERSRAPSVVLHRTASPAGEADGSEFEHFFPAAIVLLSAFAALDTGMGVESPGFSRLLHRDTLVLGAERSLGHGNSPELWQGARPGWGMMLSSCILRSP